MGFLSNFSYLIINTRNLQKVKELKQKFRRIAFTNVPRTDIHIRQVDQLANQALDAHAKHKSILSS